MGIMNRLVVAGMSVSVLFLAGLVVAQTEPAAQGAGAAMGNTRIAIIDIERIASESNEGKEFFDNLKVENKILLAEREKRAQEIGVMQAKANSEILSQDARLRLQRDIQKKQTDAQRWLEDAEAEFNLKRQEGEVKFQEKLGPIVEAVAQENNIGLIFRATPGLTFVLDDNLDISGLVIKKLDATADASSGGE
jgi:outer membrane protein